MGLHDFTFYDLINRNGVAFGSNICWHEVDDGRQLTFAEFKDRVDSLAAGLSRLSLKKGDRIAVMGKNSLEYFLLYGAAAALGTIILPINWRLSADEVCYNVNDCQPKVAFVDQEFQAILEEKKDQLPSIASYYNLRADSGTALPFSSLIEGDGHLAPADVKSTDGFVIIHTAAVAGRPRGALLSHGNMISANTEFNYCMEITAGDVHLNLLPLFHVGGLFLASSTFQAGAINLNVSKFEAKGAAKLIQEHGVSVLFDFPPILDSILKAAKEAQYDIASLRAVVGLGTQEAIEEYQSLAGGHYYALYGQTETSCVATLGRYRDRPGSAGRAVMLADIRLVDDYDRAVAIGEVGEITVKGPLVFQGYWGLPEDSAYTFRDGRHHTGDLGRFDQNGFLFYAGRKAEKELIKPGGENVYPAEVEKVILEHEAVVQTVVIGVPDPKWKEGIKAICQLHDGKSVTSAELIRFVGERIARFKKPQYVQFVSQIPLRTDGSPDREAVKSLYGSV